MGNSFNLPAMFRRPGVFIVIAAVFLLSACSSTILVGPLPTPPTVDQYPNGQLLVNTDWLNANLDHPDLTIIDLRDSDDYARGHIPNAVHIQIGDITERINDIPFEFDQEGVQSSLNGVGLTKDKTVVLYDDLGMMNSGRMFWTLEYVGHADVRVLDGGWNAWQADDLPTTVETPDVVPTDYTLDLNPTKLADQDYILEHLEDPEVRLLDARSPAEFRGEVRLADRGGHIPGAINFVWLEALQGGDAVYTIEEDWQAQLEDADLERLKSADELQALLEARGISPTQEIITYCQTLWRGSHLYFMLRLMGYERVRGYDGSWAEWGNDASLPAELESPSS